MTEASDVYLFHQHFYVPEPKLTEEQLVQVLGMQVTGRFGYCDGEYTRFEVEAGWGPFETGAARFRLTELRQGSYTVVLGQGNRPTSQLEHVGFRVTGEVYDECLKVGRGKGMFVQEGSRRTFLGTPFGMRIELVAPRHGRSQPVGDVENASMRLQQITFGARQPGECLQFLTELFGQAITEQVTFKYQPGVNLRTLNLKRTTVYSPKVVAHAVVLMEPDIWVDLRPEPTRATEL